MKNKKYKILLLSDLKSSTESILKTTMNLAQIIGADVNLFHVKKPIDVVKKESQLSAMRTINRDHTVTYKAIKDLVFPYQDTRDVTIKTAFALGNVKNEIKEHIEKVNPDLVVIGKRKSNPLKFIGDKITDFVMDNYQGAILIATDANVIRSNKDLSLGVFNLSENSLENKITKELVNQAQVPLKSFRLVKKVADTKQTSHSTDTATVEYVFEQNDNTVKNLSNYLIKNNINLLLLDRMQSNVKTESGLLKSEMKQIINNMNVSMLLPGNEQFELN